VSPRFTVLMPTHYRPDVIGFAIQSVLNQTETDFELLIVGDGASTDTAAAVGRFTDRRIRWFDLPKAPGFGYANRNIALRESRGELIAFATDDDLMFPDHLALHGAALADQAKRWSYSRALWVSSDGIAAPDLTNLLFIDERDHFAKVNTLCAGSVVFRADAFPGRASIPEHVPRGGDWVMFKQLLASYGLAAMAPIRAPTLLHFKAGQKESRHSGFAQLEAFLTIADHAAWWPELLRPSIPDGTPPQAVYAAKLATPGAPASLRNAALDVVNRVALNSLISQLESEGRTQRHRQSSFRAADATDLAKSNAALRAKLVALRSSTSWRLTRPLRTLAGWLPSPRQRAKD
jgi:glycosyltransferase involved in cell wall biosynthesis